MTAPAYQLGPGVRLGAAATPYVRAAADPLVRPLRCYALDPAASVLDGCVATLRVPYEPLAPGPVGAELAVDPYDAVRGLRYRAADLDASAALLGAGYDPAPTDPRFHQQMVYAIAADLCATFRAALGRPVVWGFRRGADPDGRRRLRLRPHGFAGADACYDRERGAVDFGYYRSATGQGRTPPGGWVFTALSHDAVAHELTHALLDGLRAQFSVPTGPDVAAFHEAFADLTALLHRFRHRELVRAALAAGGGTISRAALLTDVAAQVGATRPHAADGVDAPRRAGPLRRVALGTDPPRYDAALESHALGAVLVSAAFDGFETVFRRRTAHLRRLAGVDPEGLAPLPAASLGAELLDALTDEAQALAARVLAVAVRAIDYCPPVDVTFGEYLRAVVTADADVAPDDPWGHREAWVDAFARRGIYPRHVAALTPDALRWYPPDVPVPPVAALAFAALRFGADPGAPAGPDELERQAHAIGALVTDPAYAASFGLALPGDPRLDGDAVDPPTIESVRAARRIGSAGALGFDLIAEVTQRRLVGLPDGSVLPFLGGATLVVGPSGECRYVVRKSLLAADRLAHQRAWHERTGAPELPDVVPPETADAAAASNDGLTTA